MTNQLETAKEWLSDLNKIIDKTDNERTKERRDVLEWLVESVEGLKKENKSLNREIGVYAGNIGELSIEIGSRLKDLEILATRMCKPND